MSILKKNSHCRTSCEASPSHQRCAGSPTNNSSCTTTHDKNRQRRNNHYRGARGKSAAMHQIWLIRLSLFAQNIQVVATSGSLVRPLISLSFFFRHNSGRPCPQPPMPVTSVLRCPPPAGRLARRCPRRAMSSLEFHHISFPAADVAALFFSSGGWIQCTRTVRDLNVCTAEEPSVLSVGGREEGG